LNAWDFDDGVIKSSDFLGRAVIYLPDAASSENDTIPEPKWHKIRMGYTEDDPSMGEILVSFSIVSMDYVFK